MKRRTPETWPPGKPNKINKDAWFYEERRGITVVRQYREPKTDLYVATTQTPISWKALAGAVDRWRAAKKRVKR